MTVTPILILKTWLLILKINFREQNLTLRIRSWVSRPKFCVKKYNEPVVTWLISGARIKFIMEHTTFFHEVHTLSCFLSLMKQNLHFQNASSHKETVKRPTKFPAHSVLLKQKCKTSGCRPQAKNNFSKIQQTKPFAGPFLLPKNFNLLCLNCTCKHWQLVQTAVGVSGYCIIFLEK